VVDRQPPLDLLGEDRPMTVRSLRTLAATAALTAALGLAAACSSHAPQAKQTSSSSSASSPTAPAVAPAPPPAKGACYDLDLAEAAEATSSAPPVTCRKRHTAVTIRVGTIHPVVDGHLLAVDSDTVQRQIESRCRAAFAAYVGGDAETQRLSRLTVVWFSPSLAESDRGALWFRCDLVALAGRNRLAALPRSSRNLLAADGALDRFGTCGTAAPATSRFKRVICSEPHTWRARATIELPKDARYLGKAAGAAAESTCHDIDARLAADILRLEWSFEWPTHDQWSAGQRYGFCWTPDPA
jgi:hypothetical protein